jgi:hypothetical protein
MNITAILFFLFVDHFNIMVQYEKWVQRSMPEPFEIYGTWEREYPRELDLRFVENLDKLKVGKISRDFSTFTKYDMLKPTYRRKWVRCYENF